MLKLLRQILSYDPKKLEALIENYHKDDGIYEHTATFLLAIMDRYQAEFGESPFTREFEIYARGIGPFVLMSEQEDDEVE